MSLDMVVNDEHFPSYTFLQVLYFYALGALFINTLRILNFIHSQHFCLGVCSIKEVTQQKN